MFLLGIDIGTSGTKTVLFNEQGKALASYTGEYPLYQPNNGWAEQDPEDWWKATVDGIRAVLNAVSEAKNERVAVGLSGQMHGLVMLDKEGKLLRRSIIWCDQRTGEEVGQMNRTIGQRRLIEITANPAMTGFTAAKILWVQNHEPEIFSRCAHILLPKDYIRYRLTGEFATEVSDASGMQLMDVKNRCWSSELLTEFNIDRDTLGTMYESPQLTGTVHDEASSATGLPVGTPVAAGAGDNPAAAIGTGIVRQGRAFNTIGTSAVIYAVTDELRLDLEGRIHSLCASVPGKWTLMSCTQSAGLSLRWLRDTCCSAEVEQAKSENKDPYYIMDKLASDVPIGADRLLFLPYLMGERSPHPDPLCRSAFVGLSARHNRPHLIRAVMEGVAYSQRECLDVFREMGVNVDTMTVCGGGGRSKLWRQMLADVYNCPVNTLKVDEGGALGAALLAGVGAGVFGSVEQACEAVVQYNDPQLPSANANDYEPYYALYKKLYPALKPVFDELAGV
ncbi:MAG: xylulokinase [Clostridiales bacterium]|jgi:xylulokinase|nr:xylulokinase [Clostridiales bacterium]